MVFIIPCSIIFFIGASNEIPNTPLDKDMNVEGSDAQEGYEEIDIILRPPGKKNDFEKLERLLLQTLEIVMVYDDEAELEILEECLSVVDDVKKELAFLRAKIYKEIFRRKFASII
jgi:hypothetical protein